MAADGGKTLSEEEARRLQSILGPHTFRIIVEQPTWHGTPLFDPAQMPLRTNRPAPPNAAQAVTPGSVPVPTMPVPSQPIAQRAAPSPTAAGAAAVQQRPASPPPVPASPAPALARPERRTPVVPDVDKLLKPEDWLAPIEKSMKDARAELDLVAEEFVRLGAAGGVTADNFDQMRKALDYLNGSLKVKEGDDKKQSATAKQLREAFSGVQKSMLLTSATLAGVYAGLHHFAASANPGLVRAMDGAMGLLQARIGGALLPEIDFAIDSVMELADWFSGLNSAAKKLVAGGVIAIPALISLGSAARALSPVLTVATAAMAKMTAVAKDHATAAHVGIGLGTIAGAGGAAYAFYQLAQAHSDKYNAAVNEQGAAQGRVTSDEMREARRVSRRLGAHDDVTDEQFEKMGDDERRAYYYQRAAVHRDKYARMTGDTLSSLIMTEGEKKEQLNAAMIFERAAKEGSSIPAEEAERKKIQRQSMRVSAVQQENQPRYSPLTEARKQLQLQLFSKNRYEQEILKEQRKHRVEEIRKLDEMIRTFRERFKGVDLYQ